MHAQITFCTNIDLYQGTGKPYCTSDNKYACKRTKKCVNVCMTGSHEQLTLARKKAALRL